MNPRRAFGVATALLLCASPAAGQEDAQIAAAIAIPMRALDAALAREAALPLATSDAERLIRLGAIDQSFRLQLHKLKLDGLTPELVKAAFAAIAARAKPIDQRNRDAVMGMLPEEGWFSIAAYRKEAAEAAFHIINHADADAQRQVLPAIERMALRGEADPTNFATMYDKLQIKLGLPQRYGTQFVCVDHRRELYRLEDPARVEALRMAMKFRISLAEMLKQRSENSKRC